MKTLTHALTIASLVLSAGIAPATAQHLLDSGIGLNLISSGPIGSPSAGLIGSPWRIDRNIPSRPLVSYVTPRTQSTARFTASCEIGAGGTIEASLNALIGDRSEGEADQLHYVDDNGTAYVIPVSVTGVTGWRRLRGVAFTAESTDPFWQTLLAGGMMTYGLPGQEVLSLPLDGAAYPIGQMLKECESTADLAVATP
jgi:hypothetical protein